MNMNLRSLQGWLIVYLVYLLIGVGLTTVSMGQGLLYSFGSYWTSMALLGFGLLAFATYSLTQTGKPWVRILHIALNGITVALLMANTMGLPAVPYLGWIVVAPLSGMIYLILPYDMIPSIQPIISGSSAVLAAAWTAYWVMSARVRDTYLALVPETDIAPDVVSDAAPDTLQETVAPQDGYITEEDASRGQVHQSAQAPRPPNYSGPAKPGMSNLVRGCLIALGLIVIGAIIIVSMFLTFLEEAFG